MRSARITPPRRANGFVNRRSTVQSCPPAQRSGEKTEDQTGGHEANRGRGPSRFAKRLERVGLPSRKDLIRQDPGYRRTYNTWVGMKQRCFDPNARNFADYGGRGITVCQRWRDFDLFLVDMGFRPDGMTIDRIEGNGHYEPGNCRWADAVTQARNREDWRRGVALAESAEARS